MVRFYERTLDIALRFRFITLMVFVATVALTGVLYAFIPKGFFPTQDTGIVIGITDAAQDLSYDRMSALQHQVDEVVLHDPAVASVVSSVGAGTAGQTANNGRMYITLKPWSERSDTRHAGDQPDRTEDAGGLGHPAVHAAGAGCQRRRQARRGRCTSIRCRTTTRTS